MTDMSELEHIDFEKFWAAGIRSDKLEVVVHVRRAEDIEALIAENNALKDQVRKLQRDVLRWSDTGTKYLEALDDLRALQTICARLGIDFDFRSLR